MQAIEDMLPIAGFNPDRVKVIASVNPHYHYPVDEEVRRQLALGAVALKVHPVHAGVAANDRMLYPAYEACQAAGVPVVVHCGTSTFPGSSNAFGDPVVLDDVLRDFRSLTLVLAHGGRGWWYDAAAFLALSHERVWIELSGLPPSRLRDYYARQNWSRLDEADDLRHRLAGHPRHRRQRPRGRQAHARRGHGGGGPGRQRGPGLQPQAGRVIPPARLRAPARPVNLQPIRWSS